MVSPQRATANVVGRVEKAAVPTGELERLAKLLIFAMALVLRVYGLGWALPNASRFYSYHPDESIVTSAALGLNPFLLKVDPHFYNYGSLSLLLDSIAFRAGALLHVIGSGPAEGIPATSALLAARLITVGLGTATCVVLYATARRFYGISAAIVAAGFYAIAPLAVQQGHWATVDVPATFWISGALYFAVRALASPSNKFDFLWCGIWTGLAAATKYNAAVVLLAGFAATYFVRTHALRNSVLLLSGALAALLLGSPAIILNPRGVMEALAFESGHARAGHGDVFTNTSSGFIYHVAVSLNWGMTIPLLAVSLAGLAFAIWKRRQVDIVLLAFALPYYVLIGFAQVKFARYTLPLFPPLFLFTGALLQWILAMRKRGITLGAYLAYTLAGTSALVLTLAFDRIMTLPDTRDTAAKYISDLHVSSVGFATGPWFFSPTLNPLMSSPIPATAQKYAGLATDIRLIPCVQSDPTSLANGWSQAPTPVEWDYDIIYAADPDAVAVSEFEYGPALRIRRPEAEDFLLNVEKKYPTRHVFAKPLEVLGISFTKLGPEEATPIQGLPHDMLYTNPTTVVFTK